MDIENKMNIDESREVSRVAFITAVLATVFSSLYLVGLVGRWVVDGSIHSVSSPPLQVVTAVLAILLNLDLVVLFVALRWQVAASHRVFADLAALFMAMVCTVSCINWFSQLAVVPGLERAGNTALLALVDVHDPGSLLYAIEHLGWGIFFGLSMIFMAFATREGRFAGLVRGLLAAGGSLSLLHVFGILLGIQVVTDLGYLAWGVLLPATTLLMAIRSRA